MRKETRAIFVETPVNPTCRVLDLRGASHLTKETGSPSSSIPPSRAR
jgi:cystathionine beta-lyase/cystathionine gamma-synthase